ANSNTAPSVEEKFPRNAEVRDKGMSRTRCDYRNGTLVRYLRYAPVRKLMKETINKLNIRYLGFESVSAGRRMTFFVSSPGREPSRVTFDIPLDAFSGEHKISFQESAAVCYEKLKDLIDRDQEVQDTLHFTLNESDIQQFRPRRRRAAVRKA